MMWIFRFPSNNKLFYLKNYLTDKAYDNANQTDLWMALGNQAIAEGSDINVPEVMDTWVLQMGYPVVTVNVNRQSGSAQISQKHFLMDDTKEPDPKYPSPFGYRISHDFFRTR